MYKIAHIKHMLFLLFSHSVISMQPHGLQYSRPPYPSPSSGTYSNSCPLDRWCPLCCPLLLLPSIYPSIRDFFNDSALHIRWPQYWSFSLSVSPSNEYSELISLGWTSWISLQSMGLSRVFFNTTVQKHQFFGAQLSLWSNSHIYTRLEKSQL